MSRQYKPFVEVFHLCQYHYADQADFGNTGLSLFFVIITEEVRNPNRVTLFLSQILHQYLLNRLFINPKYITDSFNSKFRIIINHSFYVSNCSSCSYRDNPPRIPSALILETFSLAKNKFFNPSVNTSFLIISKRVVLAFHSV